MAIEWPNLTAPTTSDMNVSVTDNDGLDARILDDSAPIKVNVSWKVPPIVSSMLGGDFRVRAFAESIGPGFEEQIGSTVYVPVVPFQTDYATQIVVPAGSLPGEDVGPSASGVYKIVGVLQHRNGGAATETAGFASAGGLVQVRTP